MRVGPVRGAGYGRGVAALVHRNMRHGGLPPSGAALFHTASPPPHHSTLFSAQALSRDRKKSSPWWLTSKLQRERENIVLSHKKHKKKTIWSHHHKSLSLQRINLATENFKSSFGRKLEGGKYCCRFGSFCKVKMTAASLCCHPPCLSDVLLLVTIQAPVSSGFVLHEFAGFLAPRC